MTVICRFYLFAASSCPAQIQTFDYQHQDKNSNGNKGCKTAGCHIQVIGNWLSLKGAEIEVKNIKDALIQADPDNKDYYEINYNDFTEQLNSLYNEYKEKFQSAERKSFVTGHAAFSYLCRDFGLEQNSVKDTFAEGEPSAQQLTELVEKCISERLLSLHGIVSETALKNIKKLATH